MNYTWDDLSRETGLPRQTLRVWIQGYRMLGSRRDTYTVAHLEKLQLVDRALRGGYPLDTLARMSRKELRKLLEGRAAGDYLAETLEAIQAIDAQALSRALRQAALRLPLLSFLEEVVTPLLEAVGRFWERGTLNVATEHLVSVVVRSELGRLYESGALEADAPAILVTTPAGHRHELGALMAALIANQSGWQAVFLGGDLPTGEILHMAGYLKTRVVALSAVFPLADEAALGQVRELRQLLPGPVKLVMGGRAAADYGSRLEEIGVQVIGSLAAFETYLRET